MPEQTNADFPVDGPPPTIWPPSVITGTITAVGEGCISVEADGHTFALRGTDSSYSIGTNVEVYLSPSVADAPCPGEPFYALIINVKP